MHFSQFLSLFVILIFSIPIEAQNNKKIPPYIHQCKESDPKLTECAVQALHHIRPYLKQGIPEIEMPPVEPFRIDSLSLALTTGPNGYKITLRDVDIYGASNYTISKLKLSKNGSPFEAKVKFQKMSIDAKYTSSGVLIILPASGNGTFHADFSDVTANVRFSTTSIKKNGKTYYNVERLDLDLIIKEANMVVKKIFNNNKVLIEATNLFLRENGDEVLKVMMPQLRTKLAAVFKKVANTLLNHVPVEQFLTA
ncbi:juvenile hormone binding protein 1 [Lycorma delicatula]|uniref:juvenile hormone binding protein 1 n=1 Tax=Lycorma delicatula TaxID=130591 RepID=UPI003F517B88